MHTIACNTGFKEAGWFQSDLLKKKYKCELETFLTFFLSSLSCSSFWKCFSLSSRCFSASSRAFASASSFYRHNQMIRLTLNIQGNKNNSFLCSHSFIWSWWAFSSSDRTDHIPCTKQQHIIPTLLNFIQWISMIFRMIFFFQKWFY